jgi:predicted signal transduction protein with EAL and GGDEF domain
MINFSRRSRTLLSASRHVVQRPNRCRAPGDLIAAAGVNFLGGEFDASYREIEHKVAARTAELDTMPRELESRVLHDELTNLPNRTLIWDRLAQRMMLVQRRHVDFAVPLVDLDKFRLTHAAGAIVLSTLQEALPG